jgi:hypothetical protein
MGVAQMTGTYKTMHRKYAKANILLFLLFITGAALGCLLVWKSGLSGQLFDGLTNQQGLEGLLSSYDRASVFLWNGKFLLLIFLLSYVRWGAAMLPPLFGVEGLLLGGVASSIIPSMGLTGGICLCILLGLRLLLVLPYSFLLGGWAVEESLSFGELAGNRTAVLVLTLAVILVASFLECTLARWLGGMYYLKFGV